MEKVNKEVAEKAVANYLEAKRVKKEAEAIMKDAEAVVENFSLQNFDGFTDKRMPCGIGIIQIRSGSAKPMRLGKPLNTAERKALAEKLPSGYVKLSPDFGAIFASNDSKLRTLLRAESVEVVREDSFSIV